MKKLLVQFIKFGLVGVSNTVVYYLVYALVYTFSDNYILSNVVGWAISVINAYIWQNMFVFREQEDKAKRVWWRVLIKTYMAYAFTGLIVNNVLLWLWMDVIGIGNYCSGVILWLESVGVMMSAERFAGYIAPLLNAAVTIPTNFVINKFWAYRQ